MAQINTKQWFVEQRIQFDCPLEYRKLIIKRTRELAGRQIFNILFQQPLPAVVDIDEEIVKVPSEFYFPEKTDSLLRIKISVTPVQYRNVVIDKTYLDFDKIYLDPKKENKIKKFFKKLIGRK